jgi:hypothetical protein
MQHALPEYRYVTLDDPAILEQAHSDPVYFLDSVGDRCIIHEIQLRSHLTIFAAPTVQA